MEKHQINNVVEVIQFGAALSAAVDNAKKDDGKIDMKDIAHLLPVIPFVGPALDDVAQVVQELGDVDDQEFEEIAAELAKVSVIGSKAEVLEGVRVHLYAAKANYAVFQYWKNKA